MPEEERWRLFVGVPVEGPAAAALRDWVAAGRRQQPGLKWVEPHNLHLTLRFLGERPPADVLRIGDAVATVTDRWEPLPVVLRGLGAFPSLRRARTVWAGVGEGEPRLAELAGCIEAVLVGALPDLKPVDHPFRGHVTLARVRSGWLDATGWPHLVEARERVWGTLHVGDVVLYRSRLRPAGPVYTPVHRWTLSARGPGGTPHRPAPAAGEQAAHVAGGGPGSEPLTRGKPPG